MYQWINYVAVMESGSHVSGKKCICTLDTNNSEFICSLSNGIGVIENVNCWWRLMWSKGENKMVTVNTWLQLLFSQHWLSCMCSFVQIHPLKWRSNKGGFTGGGRWMGKHIDQIRILITICKIHLKVYRPYRCVMEPQEGEVWRERGARRGQLHILLL